MKRLIFLLWLSFSLAANGQQVSRPLSEWKPLYYLDSVNIGATQFYFDFDKIKDINIVGDYYDSAKQVHGKVFLKSKTPGNYSFITIPDVARIYNKGSQSPTIYMIDNEFLKDISQVKIDTAYILRVDLVKTTEIAYLKDTSPGWTILKIITKTKENVDKHRRCLTWDLI